MFILISDQRKMLEKDEEKSKKKTSKVYENKNKVLSMRRNDIKQLGIT